MLNKYSLPVTFLMLLAAPPAVHAQAIASAPTATVTPGAPPAQRAIVNGHHVQPRSSTLAAPDVSPAEAQALDELYRKQVGQNAR